MARRRRPRKTRVTSLFTRTRSTQGRPLPLGGSLGGGGPFLLASVASLEKRGEGVALATNMPPSGVSPARVTPSPFASKLASSLRGEALPHQGGGGGVLDPSWNPE